MHDSITIAGCMLRKLFSGWFLFTLLSGLALVALVSMQSGPDDPEILLRDCRRTGTYIILGMTLLLVIITGSNEIPKEVDTGVLLFVLAKPVSRKAIVMGKLMGLLGAATASVILNGLVSWGILWLRGLRPEWSAACELLFTGLRAWTIAAVIVLMSTIANELATFSLGAACMGLAFFVKLLDQLIVYGGFGNETSFCLRILYYTIPNFGLLSSEQWLARPVPIFYLLLATAYALSYVGIAAWIATKTFSIREFNWK